MRTTICKFTLPALMATVAFAQSTGAQTPDRTFFLTNLTSDQDLTTLTTALRTAADIQSIAPDVSNHSIVARGTVDQMVAAEWLIHELDQPASADRIAVSAGFKMAGANGDILQVFRLNPSASPATVTTLVTGIRTVADVQRLFPMSSQRIVIGRASAEKMAAAEWLFQQVTPPDGHTPTADSPLFPMAPDGTNRPAESVRVLRLDPSSTNVALTSAVTAIRTVADVQRLMPVEFGRAIIAKAPDEKRAVAEWIVHELIQPSHPSSVAQFTMAHDATMPRDSREIDDAVRVYYVHATNAQLTALVTQIRATSDIQRIMPVESYSAIVLRGRPDQVSIAQSIVDKFNAAPAGENPPVK